MGMKLFRLISLLNIIIIANQTIAVKHSVASNWMVAQSAELQLLDKITARISTTIVPVGGGAEFGTLELRVHYCAYRPPEETPENAAFIIIYDNGYGDRKLQQTLFSGWMFASSPAISGLEHPVYDVTLLSCNKE